MEKVIYTSNYYSVEHGNKIYISKDKGNVLDNYAGELYTIAARLRIEADEAEQKYLEEKK